MSSINLMSPYAQRHNCIRARVRQWTRIISIVCLALGALTVQRFLVYRSAAHRQLALEATYDPIEELKTSNKMLARQVTAIRNEEQFVLALSDQEPTITLLGLLSMAVADAKERVFLQKIELSNLGLVGTPSTEKKTVLEIAGVANSGNAVSQFADTLRGSLSFGSVEVTSSKDYRIKTQAMQDFALQCDFQ